MQILTYRIGKEESGKTISEYLRNCHGFSRRAITRLKQGCGSLSVNGVSVSHLGVFLKEGDLLEVGLASGKQELSPNSELDVPVRYEDEAVVVFAKPAGMPVHPSHLHREDTLLNVCAARYRDSDVGFHLINRLDRDTSGLCVVAKNPVAASRLSKTVEKTYYAVVEGIMEPDAGVITFPIARARESIILRQVDPAGQPALTEFKTIERGNGHTLLQIRLGTGRTHQIRVHFSYIGHPLAGDDLYGGSLDHICRQALHCGEVVFPHPFTGKEIALSEPLPAEFRRLLWYEGE